MKFLIFIIFLAGIIVGTVFLQMFLSKTHNKWTGLILPLITLCISILAVLGITVFVSHTSQTQTISENGEIITKIIENTPKEVMGSISSVVFQMIFIFIIYNIPTMILLAIYAVCREKIKKNSTTEKMNIIDLK